MTQVRKHVCDTDDPQRPCCWMARRVELEAMKARQATPEFQAQKAADDARRTTEHADSFIGKGID